MGFLMTLLGGSSLAWGGPRDTGELISTVEQVRLLELFSSEGCSSCPPADEWLASLRTSPGLWKTFVPIEFHVDYWNRLGWVDPFSKSQFTTRQSQYAAEWGNGNIYTPGFVLSGEEWRARNSTAIAQAGQKKAGILKARKIGPGKFSVSFTPAGKGGKNWVIHGALLGNRLRTEVRSGENGGRTLEHEFVVLSLVEEQRGEIQFHLSGTAKPKSYSVAFWVTEPGSLKPVQAVGGDISFN